MNDPSRATALAELPLVLHVIPTATARGAQREARALADELDRPGERHHRVLSLFDGTSDVAVDAALGFPGGDTPAQGFDPRVVLRLRPLLARMDPDVLVAHGSEPLKYLVPAMIGRRRPLAYYAIGTYSGTRGASQLRLWRFLLGRADAIAAEGEEVREECIDQLGVAPHRVALAPNGRDPEVFRPGRPRSGGPPTVLFVGALTDGKRPDEFLRTITDLRSRGIDLEATLIGDGPVRASLEPAAAEAGVAMLGSRSDVAEQMRRADLLVFPSRPTGEGMPGVLIEAGLSGLPVVATAAPGVSWIVRDGETGVVVPVEDHHAMVEATATLLADPGLRSSMGGAARRHCLANFSLGAVADRWLTILRPLLETAEARGRVAAVTG